MSTRRLQKELLELKNDGAPAGESKMWPVRLETDVNAKIDRYSAPEGGRLPELGVVDRGPRRVFVQGMFVFDLCDLLI